MVRGARAAAAVSITLAVASACSARSGAVRIGYSATAYQTQQQLEQRFRANVSPDQMSRYHKAVTARPHMAGTEGARVVADSLRAFLAAAGLEAEINEHQAYLSHPNQIAIDLVAPDNESLRVTEPASDRDPDTSHPELGPGFIAYSATGDVTAEVVYVNYGLPADYMVLAEQGVRVAGRIAIARYGRSHRAVKVHTAEQNGAVGLILYSDPADDGFARGSVWPGGYWRTDFQLQRGNAKYSWFWHGDPLTPGVAALPDAPRLDPATAPTLPRIPVAVLAYGEARKILGRMSGPWARPSFKGKLPISYRLGDEKVRVRLQVRMDAGLRTIRNVIARVPGARQPDRGIMFGTHHDAWTFGGVDPGTGMSALLELARGLGQLRRSGWQPERSITIAFWDAEEFGLIGSTEYAEQYQHQLRENTIAYINTDLYTNGRFDPGGTPSLGAFLTEVADDVGIEGVWRLKALGSGADFVPFQDFLGLPTLSLEFSETGYSFGPYHSNYDTRFFVERVADPGFKQGVDLVRLLGTVALRLTEAPVLPFRFSDYAKQLADVVQPPPPPLPESPDIAPIRLAVLEMRKAALELERRIDGAVAADLLTARQARTLNDLLARLEQRLLDESAPPNQRWYRHLVFGWNIYSLYDGQLFPTLAKDGELIAAAVNRMTEGLNEAARMVPLRQ